MDTFGSRLKSLRKNNSLSQKELAKLVGINSSYISRLENASSAPSASLLKLISKEFNINEEWLKSGTGVKKNSELADSEINVPILYQGQYFKKLPSYDTSLYSFTFMESIENNFLRTIDIEIVPEEKRKEYLQFISEMFSVLSNIASLLKGTYVTSNSNEQERKELIGLYQIKINDLLLKEF